MSHVKVCAHGLQSMWRGAIDADGEVMSSVGDTGPSWGERRQNAAYWDGFYIGF